MYHLLTTKELPDWEKPYEKCLKSGVESLSVFELLAIIIRTGAKGVSSIELAKTILRECGKNKGLAGLYDLTVNKLKRINGIGNVKAIQIRCICELSKRISKSSASNKLRLNSPKSIADYYMEELRHKKIEYLISVMFDSKNGMIADKVISLGTVDSALISPREIYIEALKNEAVYIVLVHNHPSGDITPSNQDILATQRLEKSGSLLGIKLIDHIIIGDKTYYSFNESGLL